MAFVNVDAKQLEWRTALWLSNDPVGIKEILSGDDVHEKNQLDMGLPDRITAKRFLFRTIFRGSGYSFANDPDFMHVSKSEDYWDQRNESFYTKYSNLDAVHKEWSKQWAEGKPIVGPTGRRWVIPKKNGSLKVPITQLANYPVQGTGHDIMAVARLSAKNRMDSLGLVSRIVQTVHDSIVADCPKQEVSSVVNIFYEVFDDLTKNFKLLYNVDMPIPFPGEVKVGTNLADMVEINKER